MDDCSIRLVWRWPKLDGQIKLELKKSDTKAKAVVADEHDAKDEIVAAEDIDFSLIRVFLHELHQDRAVEVFWKAQQPQRIVR